MTEKIPDLIAHIRASREARILSAEIEEPAATAMPPSDPKEKKHWIDLIEEAALGGPSSRL